MVLQRGGDRLPVALLPGAAVGGVMQVGLLQGHWRFDGGRGDAITDFQDSQPRQGRAAAQDTVHELVHFPKRPDMAVRQAYHEVDLPETRRHEPIRFLVAIEWIREVRRAVEEQDGTADLAKVS